MEHTLFGCLRSPHATSQSLHPFAQSSLALHGRSDHMSYPDISSSSSSCIIAGYPNEEGMFGSQHHRGHHHHHHQQQQHHHHQSLQSNWHIPQMSSHLASTRHSLCLQQESGPPQLGSSPPILCSNASNLGTNSSSGSACASGDYGRQTLSPSDTEKRSGKRKSDSSVANFLFLRILFLPNFLHNFRKIGMDFSQKGSLLLKSSLAKDK
ncbi:unnamed protein product [Ranitomeya imitator]|uniref:Homeobox protein MOX-2 n=1 Tax=Ranitomeya imitator TaxID=111125 RepID=A0ABN9L8S8_9NEOB|nr:unnamed protein product [Ranitomeya imitator]